MRRHSFFRLFYALCLWILFLGCAASGSQPMYYWGKYSESLYQTKKHPGTETLAEHKIVLEKIIENSKEKNCRIPPGVCAELGYLYAMQNDNKKAIELFTQEKQVYPESALFMDRLIQRSERKPEAEKPLETATPSATDKPQAAAVEQVGTEEKTK